MFNSLHLIKALFFFKKTKNSIWGWSIDVGSRVWGCVSHNFDGLSPYEAMFRLQKPPVDNGIGNTGY